MTNRQGVNHGLETHVDLATADDLGDIGGIVRLQESNLQALILEVTTSLGEVKGGVVRGGVPASQTQPDVLNYIGTE